jgi:HEAT repeat protein
MKTLTPAFLVPLVAVLLAPANVSADGMFVVPKFVWDKHKDINEPTQKAILVYDAGREDLILQVKYEGPVDEFGWLIPVPNLPTVQEGSMKCFYELSQYTQKLWEHPVYETKGRGMDLASEGIGVKPEPPVKVIEIKTVGAYEIVVLSTKDSGALSKWLEANQFYFPTNKTDVLDAYVKQQWYFVAVRINLSASRSFRLLSPRQAQNEPIANYSTHLKLAGGELNPLQISFATDRCVFPLKISSVNGKPSEVQVYVLSPEPLLEKGMLEKQLPPMYNNDVERAKRSAAEMEQNEMNNLNMRMRFMGASASANSPLSVPLQKAIERQSQTLVANSDILLPYAKVTEKDLPDCSNWIPRLAGKSWWLTKQTWTFQPEDMRDLLFESALAYFTDELGTKYGYYAVESLAHFDSDAVPAFLAAFQSTNPVTRVNAASIFNRHYGYPRDPRINAAAPAWLKDSESQVRMAGVEVMTDYGNWNTNFAEPVIAMLRDLDPGVRGAAVFALPRFRSDLEPYLPEFEQLLNDPNPDIQYSGVQLLQRLGYEVPPDNLLTSLKSTNLEVVSVAYSQLKRQGEKLTDDQALALLQNPEATVRTFGLDALGQNREKQSIELALPFLKDPDEMVRLKAAQVLHVLTGQPFSEDQSDEWLKWWDQNKTNLVVQPQPEELGGPPDGGAYHARGCGYYDMHNFSAALADFRKSCELGSEVQDYSYYRIWLIRARSGEKEAATQELVSYLKNCKAQNPPDWPLQIGLFLTGQITEADFFKAAADTNSQTGREQHCEVYFYAASKRLIENDKAGAADFLKKCLGTGVTTFEEYHSAEAELKVLH